MEKIYQKSVRDDMTDDDEDIPDEVENELTIIDEDDIDARLRL